MKNLILITYLLLTGAAYSSTTTANVDPMNSMPLSEMFWSLYQERNIVGQNDCSNKCGRYLRALIAEGYEAEIVVVKPHRSSMLHAIIKVTEGEKITYLDPTQGIVAYDLDMMGIFRESIQYNQLVSLGIQYK